MRQIKTRAITLLTYIQIKEVMGLSERRPWWNSGPFMKEATRGRSSLPTSGNGGENDYSSRQGINNLQLFNGTAGRIKVAFFTTNSERMPVIGFRAATKVPGAKDRGLLGPRGTRRHPAPNFHGAGNLRPPLPAHSRSLVLGPCSLHLNKLTHDDT